MPRHERHQRAERHADDSHCFEGSAVDAAPEHDQKRDHDYGQQTHQQGFGEDARSRMLQRAQHAVGMGQVRDRSQASYDGQRQGRRRAGERALVSLADEHVQADEEEQPSAHAREGGEEHERPLDVHYFTSSFHSAYLADRM